MSQEEHDNAPKVGKVFNRETMFHYHNLDLIADALILADAFEKIRKVFLTNHDMDPCYCFFILGLT